MRRAQHLPGNKGMLGKKHTSEALRKISESLKGKKLSFETRGKIAGKHRGRRYSPELTEHNRQALLRPEVRLKKSLGRRGEKSHFWKGGVTKKNRIIRESIEYKMWREQVFKRDNYTCQVCFSRNGNGYTVTLNADHIKPFALFQELRFDVNNGRTLCLLCHRKTATWGGRIKNKS